tara:strand:- start:1485 stop:3215 length:1731 start_codon:yes stop_codon:yes gene_type:complete
MALESVTHLDDLEVANPLGTDPRSEGDNHIRNVKKALKTDFPNINGVVAATPADLNLTTGITAGTVLASKFVLVDASKKVNEWLVDNLTIDGNSITAGTGVVNIVPASGSAIVLDGTVNVDAGVITGATSITSTAFVGTLSTAAQANITSVGTLTTLSVDNITVNANAITSTDTNGDITLTPHGTGDVILDGVKWPQADGSENYFLRTNGSAQTSWVSGLPTAIAGVLEYQFETATADSDQGAGKLWLNHATVASATVLYIDDDDDNGTDVSAWVGTWDDSTSTIKGYVSFKSLVTPSADYAIFEITGATVDGTAYNKLSVTHKVSAGTFTDAEELVVDFSRYGDTTPGDNSVTLAKMASGTDGNIISYDASGNPVAVATGNDGQVLTSAGAGAPPAFEAATTTKGVHTIYIPAGAMKPTTSNGCATLATVETTAGRPDMNVLDFDKDADEAAQFNVCFPKSWNRGTIKYQVWWAGLAATTGVAWGLQGVAVSDNGTIDVAYGTAVVVTDDAQGAVEELLISAESSAITIDGLPAENDLCYFRIFRDVSDGNDDMAGDARLLGVKLFFTTDAETDD